MLERKTQLNKTIKAIGNPVAFLYILNFFLKPGINLAYFSLRPLGHLLNIGSFHP